ncbi:hypothetical protein ACWC10_30015 [Streptomyces sp. NPDC001595]|uniref:hypothetical protein n=1 Tax=Streptomyces sp. NPDC001532 TaxID=3154520 RepID=UPI0033347EB3
MDGTRFRQGEHSSQETRAQGTMRIWQWARWAALVLAVGWAVSWVGSLIEGEGGWDLWWPLVSAVIWTGLAVNGFATYRRIKTTTPPTRVGRPSA